MSLVAFVRPQRKSKCLLELVCFWNALYQCVMGMIFKLWEKFEDETPLMFHLTF